MNWQTQTTFLSVLIVFDTCCQQSVFSQPGSEIPLPPLPIDCSLVLCLAPDCPNPVTPEGQCCPICPPPNCDLVKCRSVKCTNSYIPPGQCCPICPDCHAVTCPVPLCANPKLKPGDCCLTCEDSKCKFEGCVNFLTDGRVQWAPSPCFLCQCDEAQNQKYCGIFDCFFITEEDCFGYPVVTKPNECCPRCDFGIPDDTCGVVPQIHGERQISVSAMPGSTSCNKTITRHTCDKIGFRSEGKTYRCSEVQGRRSVRFDQNCPLIWGIYDDVTRCRVVEDEDLVVGCDLVVQPESN